MSERNFWKKTLDFFVCPLFFPQKQLSDVEQVKKCENMTYVIVSDNS